MLSSILIAILALAADEPYAWPLDLPRQVTSSFAEYRTGRFHAGIDLRTGGIGIPVRASGDGYISRVRCGPWGYGKAVYLRMNDGRSSVYGHLDDFSDPVRAYVRQAQHRSQKYTVDLYPEPGQFPVQRGEIIAKSGDTGTGAPHLHWEIRDTAERPMHPRLLGLQWPDNVRPLIRKVAIAPEGVGATVNGDFFPVILETRNTGPGQYTCDPVRVSGRIGFGVDVMDPGEGGSKLGVYRMRLLDGETEVFRMQHDLVDYNNHRNAAVAYHPHLMAEGRFLLLWRWPGNISPSYAHSPADGWLEVSGEPRDIRVEVADCAGNVSVLTVPLRPENPEPAPPPPPASNAQGKVELDSPGNYLLISVRFTAAESEIPELLIEGAGDIASPAFRRISADTFRAAFLPRSSDYYTVRVAHPRVSLYERTVAAALRGAPARSFAFDGLEIRVKPDSPYGLMIARAWASQTSPASPIRKHGDTYQIWPAAMPFDESAEIALPIPPGIEQPGRAHVYRSTGGGWARMDTKRDGNKMVVNTRGLGLFAVMEDDKPPAISDISPPDGYQAQTRRPRMYASISDVGSGIASFEIFCSGKWLLTEYHPDRGRMTWERDEDLPSGQQEILFRVTDNAGNTTTRKRTVIIP